MAGGDLCLPLLACWRSQGKASQSYDAWSMLNANVIRRPLPLEAAWRVHAWCVARGHHALPSTVGC